MMQLNYSTGWLPKSAIKAHITDPVISVTAAAWTDFTGFTTVKDETAIEVIVLNDDLKTFTILKDGLYSFGGCIHIQNNTSGNITATVLSRIMVNKTDEARCSQRGFVKNINQDGEDILTYGGTIYAKAGDELTLQYYTSNGDLEFYANAQFQEPVAATLWMLMYMEPDK